MQSGARRGFGRIELRRLLRAFRGGWRVGALSYAACMWLLIAGTLLFDGAFARAPFDALMALAAAAGYLLVAGAVFGLATGVVAVGWAMVGVWAALPVLTVPLGVALALWLGADLLADRAHAMLEALTIAAAERDWLVSGAARVAHAGPLALVILLPLLFIDLGALLVDPGVLVGLALLLAMVAALLLAGAVPAAAGALLVVLAVYLRSLRSRQRLWSRLPG